MDLTALRKALAELNGERACEFAFAGADEHVSRLLVQNAMLVPEEEDHLIKVTDGRSITVIDASRVMWVRIGLTDALGTV
ncbi:MAG: hypothetical protein AAGG07_10110 [Planctomycetota bacterium]